MISKKAEMSIFKMCLVFMHVCVCVCVFVTDMHKTPIHNSIISLSGSSHKIHNHLLKIQLKFLSICILYKYIDLYI